MTRVTIYLDAVRVWDSADPTFHEGDHPRRSDGKFTSGAGSGSGGHGATLPPSEFAAVIRRAFPGAQVKVEGGKTAWGNSHYVEVYADEPPASYHRRLSAWEAAGKGSKRGPRPNPQRFMKSFRLSDHEVGDRRSAQHHLLPVNVPADEAKKIVGQMSHAVPWLAA